jgi:hypothetical protein
MIAGGVEGARAAGRLSASGWRWTMPTMAILAGLAVGVHGGTHTHLPRFGEQLHHWIMGSAMAGGGLVHAFATRPGTPHPVWRAVLPAVLLIAGLDLILFYRVH